MEQQTKPEVIYDRVEFIGATKGRRSAYPGQKFRHDFKPGAKDIALPDRTLVVTPGGTYAPANGSALLTSRLTRVRNPARLHQKTGKDVWHVNPPHGENPPRVVFNRLLGGWYVVSGPHQTPLNGRFDSRAEATAWLRRKNPLLTVIGAANPPPPRRSSMFGNLLSIDTVKKVATAGVGAVASASLPAIVLGPDVSTGKAYLTQAVIGVGGAWAVKRFVKAELALPWFLGAAVGALQDPIRRAVAQAYGIAAGALRPGAARAVGAYYGADPQYLGRSIGVYGGRPLGPVPGLGRYSSSTPFIARGI